MRQELLSGGFVWQPALCEGAACEGQFSSGAETGWIIGLKTLFSVFKSCSFPQL